MFFSRVPTFAGAPAAVWRALNDFSATATVYSFQDFDGGAQLMQILGDGGLVLTSTTNDGTTVGPELQLYRNRGVDQVDADVLGELTYYGLDDGAPTKTKYAGIRALVLDSGDTSEDGALAFRTTVAGADTEVLRVSSNGSSTFVGIGTTTVFTIEPASPSLTAASSVPRPCGERKALASIVLAPPLALWNRSATRDWISARWVRWLARHPASRWSTRLQPRASRLCGRN